MNIVGVRVKKKKKAGRKGKTLRGFYEEKNPSSFSRIKVELYLYIKFSTIFYNICYRIDDCY